MYETVPFDINNYAKYIEALCKGKMNFKGYSQELINAVNVISEQVYPQNGVAPSMKRRRIFWLKNKEEL
jgi:hypothetical protein